MPPAPPIAYLAPRLDCALSGACVCFSLSVKFGWSAGGVQVAVFRLLFVDIDCCWFTMSNYLRRVTESVQDLPAAAVPDVRVISQQSSSDPDQVVIGFQLSQSTWDRALGAAAVVGFHRLSFTWSLLVAVGFLSCQRCKKREMHTDVCVEFDSRAIV